MYIKYSNTKVSKSHKQNVDSFWKPFSGSYEMKNGLSLKKWTSVRRKLFETFLEIIDRKTIQKFCDVIICGLNFERTLRISYEKCDEKCYHQWYLSILLNTYSY